MVEKIKQALERAYRERGNPEASVSGLLSNAKTHQVDPNLLLANRIITFHDTDSNIESYRLLRTQLLRKLKTDRLTSIGITSANANEGKSLTSVNLAISLAKSADVNVMLIDGDIAHPTIHSLFGIDPECGLVDLLKGDVKLDDVIISLSIPNLWLIPGRYENGSLLDQASSHQIEAMIDNVKDNRQNIIIVDLPPILAKDDTMAIAAHLDGTILVVEEGSTKADEVARAAVLLKQNNLIGCVLNKFSRYEVEFY